MSAFPTPAAPQQGARRTRKTGCRLHLHLPMLVVVIASSGAFGQAGAAPDAAPSAADRLRNDPVQTATVPQRKPQPPKAAQLSGEQRAVAQYIARSYRVAYESVSYFVQHAYQAASEFRLDPHLILAVMAVESSFDPHAENASGAQGLMQVLTRVHTSKFDPYGGVDAAWDPVANIRVGARILSDYVGRYGDVAAGLKAYVGAALQSTDGGYGSKVLKRQAEFDAVLRPPETAIIETATTPAAEGARAGGSIGVAGASATAGASGRSDSSRGF
jgi:soluble lytic murein transglycosylase-like protein